MGLPPFGAFKPLCRTVGSYPICNLFFRQLAKHFPDEFPTSNLYDFTKVAPVGINIECGIPRASGSGHLGNIANTIACGLSIIAVLLLVLRCSKREAAVGRAEFRALLLMYGLTLVLQILTTGSYLRQSSTGLVIVTAVHMGAVVGFFWGLLANAIVSTQFVEDGTPSSLIPFYGIYIILFGATTYISLDTAFSFTTAFNPSNPPSILQNVPLFVLTSVWPAFCAFAYFIIISYVVVRMLDEGRPLLWFLVAALLFVLSQLDYFLLSKVICKGTNAKIDGSFVATILETLSVGVLFGGWVSITEDTWEDPYLYPPK
ncbi:chitin synthase III catalytic subunit [Cantharellus anzutake]|uniref:chitin synthase III catalytic subunit n=1 Tax=Cantharellus anzutake TaxID=1750568 RepID=UPI0019037A00|nr:chitin synthase III catalytic subunit [Cantharellus anzutake]KAF8337559.1 chitin synthase III catalytic subunit [Cantharellus anzutake]